jgi:hypothetical protein
MVGKAENAWRHTVVSVVRSLHGLEDDALDVGAGSKVEAIL